MSIFLSLSLPVITATPCQRMICFPRFMFHNVTQALELLLKSRRQRVSACNIGPCVNVKKWHFARQFLTSSTHKEPRRTAWELVSAPIFILSQVERFNNNFICQRSLIFLFFTINHIVSKSSQNRRWKIGYKTFTNYFPLLLICYNFSPPKTSIQITQWHRQHWPPKQQQPWQKERERICASNKIMLSKGSSHRIIYSWFVVARHRRNYSSQSERAIPFLCIILFFFVLREDKSYVSKQS